MGGMCYHHWNLVPYPLQKMITRLYRGGRPAEGHAEACANAAWQVQQKVNRKERSNGAR